MDPQKLGIILDSRVPPNSNLANDNNNKSCSSTSEYKYKDSFKQTKTIFVQKIVFEHSQF